MTKPIIEEARELLAKIDYDHEAGEWLKSDPLSDFDSAHFVRAAPRLVDELCREAEKAPALRAALKQMTAKFRACAIRVGSDPEFVDAAIEAICGPALSDYQEKQS